MEFFNFNGRGCRQFDFKGPSILRDNFNNDNNNNVNKYFHFLSCQCHCCINPQVTFVYK